MAQDILILIPAAGAGRRMRGADKVLQLVDGRPLLARQAARARATGCPVLVTLPAPGAVATQARARALAGLDVSVVPVPEAAEGMAASVRAGARAALAAGASGLMVLPADMPDLETADLNALCAAFTAKDAAAIVRGASSAGQAGHPVILPASLLPEAAQLRGDTGARALVQGGWARVLLLRLPGQRACTDLDTPEAWAEWRAARGATDAPPPQDALPAPPSDRRTDSGSDPAPGKPD